MSFIGTPKIVLLHGGEYMLLEPVAYYSVKLRKVFQLPGKFVFSPSIPTLARIFVPVDSDIVAASLPHDFLCREAPDELTQAEADLVGREELEHRKVKKHIINRFYYALRLFGWKAWNENRRKQVAREENRNNDTSRSRT